MFSNIPLALNTIDSMQVEAVQDVFALRTKQQEPTQTTELRGYTSACQKHYNPIE